MIACISGWTGYISQVLHPGAWAISILSNIANKTGCATKVAKLWLFAGRMIASLADSPQWAGNPGRQIAAKPPAARPLAPSGLFHHAQIGRIVVSGRFLLDSAAKIDALTPITDKSPLNQG